MKLQTLQAPFGVAVCRQSRTPVLADLVGDSCSIGIQMPPFRSHQTGCRSATIRCIGLGEDFLEVRSFLLAKEKSAFARALAVPKEPKGFDESLAGWTEPCFFYTAFQAPASTAMGLQCHRTTTGANQIFSCTNCCTLPHILATQASS